MWANFAMYLRVLYMDKLKQQIKYNISIWPQKHIILSWKYNVKNSLSWKLQAANATHTEKREKPLFYSKDVVRTTFVKELSPHRKVIK